MITKHEGKSVYHPIFDLSRELVMIALKESDGTLRNYYIDNVNNSFEVHDILTQKKSLNEVRNKSATELLNELKKVLG